MRVTRSYMDAPLVVGQTLSLPEEVANHLVRVMRLREGDACVLFNGDGHDYSATLAVVGKRDAQVRIEAASALDNESPLQITLLQGIARGEKMDLIVQKATELGVHAIVPVISERSEVRLDAERARKRHAHWRSVMISACEQSGRARLPQLAMPRSLQTAASEADGEAVKMSLDPAGAHSVAELALDAGSGIVIAIGPEGGWSPRDRDVLHVGSFIGLRLGPRILRTETAGLAAVVVLQSRFGDLGQGMQS